MKPNFFKSLLFYEDYEVCYSQRSIFGTTKEKIYLPIEKIWDNFLTQNELNFKNFDRLQLKTGIRIRDAKNGRMFTVTDYTKYEWFAIRTTIQNKVYRIKYYFQMKKRFVIAHFHEWVLYDTDVESKNIISDRFNWHLSFERDAKTYFSTINKQF